MREIIYKNGIFIMVKAIKKKTKKKLSPAEAKLKKEQQSQKNEIRTILRNIGFERLGYIDGREFTYEGRTTELDDVFICENIILLTEYTITGEPGRHLINKSIFYNKVNEDKRAFVNYMLTETNLSSFGKYFNENIRSKYTINQLELQILYCSKNTISSEHKEGSKSIVYFDYNIVQYFKNLTKTIKRSSKYEFLDFLNIPFIKFGENSLGSGQAPINKFSGHILPEEKSSFAYGYKIISFYIDAESLIKRAYVLRQEGWREKESVGYYQRMFNPKKILSMRKYLTKEKRVFINNIIATISEDKIKLFDSVNNIIKINDEGNFEGNNATTNVIPTLIEINDECNIIGLIDGQHRTYAYHESDDMYEKYIAKLRKIQNLLVTGIIFPKKETKESRLKFEANLFLEINSNQTNVSSKLTQEIQSVITPFSTVAICKRILDKLNASGPFSNLIQQYSFESGKIKTASIVDYGLKPLIKLDDLKSKDSLYLLWKNPDKEKLKKEDSEEYELLEQYIDFCVETIRAIFIAFKCKLDNDKWNTYSSKTPNGILAVMFINGGLNVLRFLVENGKIADTETYKTKLQKINDFDFKMYKGSVYRKLGRAIYEQYFDDTDIS